MNSLQKHIVVGFSLCLLAISSDSFAVRVAESTDTTWPLRLAGHSTWPLRFEGAVSNSNDSQNAEITILEIENNPSRVRINCTTRSQGLQQHKATGQIVLNNKVFGIQGVCFAPETSMMEFISKDATGRTVSMIAKIPQNLSDTLRGHLRIDNRTYNVSVRRHN